MKNNGRVALIFQPNENVEGIMTSISEKLDRCEFEVIQTEDQLDHLLEEEKVDVIVTDYRLEWTNGIKILQIVKDAIPECPVILFSKGGNEDIAVRAMKLGAYDYIRKVNSNLNRLAIIVKKAISQQAPLYALLGKTAGQEPLIDEFPVGLFVMRMNGDFVTINREAMRILGLAKVGNSEELNFFECIADKSAKTELSENLDKEDYIFNRLIEIQLPSGEPRQVELNMLKKEDEKPGQVLISVHIQDQPDQIQFEEAYQQSEQKFRRFSSVINDVIYRYDPETNHYDFISPSIEYLTKYSLDEIMKDPRGMLRKITHTDDVDYVFDSVKKHLKANKKPGSLTREYRMIRKDKTEIWVSDRMHFEHGEDGKIVRVNGVLQDITAKKHAEDALRREKQFSENLIETANALVVVVDESGIIRRFNSFAEKISGYQRDEVLGSDWFNLFIPDCDRKELREYFLQILTGKNKYWDLENAITCKNNELRYIAWQNSKFMDKPDHQMMVLSIGIDMTEHRSAEEARESIQSQLYQAQKMEAIGLLAGGVAHDFNNMLTSILGYTDMTMMGIDASDQVYSDLQRIRKLSIKASDLVRKLLLFSRKQPMKLKILDVNKIIREMSDMLSRLIGEKINIHTELTKDIWNIQADRGNLEQVIMNLAVNARDAMPKGGELTIKTEKCEFTEAKAGTSPQKMSGKNVCISISDTGVGMDKDMLEQIFDPFFSTKKVGEGTGLGLSVVYGIISQHGGRVDVESQKGKGTVFKICFPAMIKKAKDKTKSSSASDVTIGHGERILVVEDEEDVRKYATKALRKHGYTVFGAGNGRDALNTFIKEGGNFDLVFCDVVLPDCHGPDLVNSFRDIRSGFEVLLTSGYPNYRNPELIKKKTKYDLLPKPYSMNSLVESICKSLKKKG